MQVFIVGSPLETARALSKRHLNNQINEAKIILDALNGAKAWRNHPCVLQYDQALLGLGYKWIELYMWCLQAHQRGDLLCAHWYSDRADAWRPKFHTQEYFDQMKRRLYTKDPQHYKQWADLGESDESYYYVDGVWRKYVNGKRIE